ncbi:discoidin domain-containing protein [Lentzea sp. NBRC 105346]|uniref:discoidin domain-containing protein n=1 Tax=Lentzea sp. NBRC 105346 TaxID=3032205 RepID=UPI0025574BD2|nr:discoidin domain-containing protein [Lentzea sp. NBRC 105346]
MGAAIQPVPAASAIGGSGATVPFTEYEAETASHNGTKIGPDYTQASLASEASGRQAVTLNSGNQVEFTLTRPANAITVRYSVPDGSQGNLGVYVNGTKATDLKVTSKYSWLDTGWIPGQKIHHFYDESRALLGRDLNANDKVSLRAESTITVDLADFEQVAGPATKPANALSITDFGATPNNGGDDAEAIWQTVLAAKQQGKEVWIPPGTFEVGRALQIDQVTIRGAGMWHSVLHSNNPFRNDSQVQGNIRLHDFAVIGEITERNDGSPDNAYHGPLGANSAISGLWMQHMKVGIWTMNGTTSNAVIENNRFLDLTADGLNFNGRVSDSVVRNNFLRNTGDDALAMWSLGGADVRCRFENNTIVQPNLANGIGIYGGTDTTLRGNKILDTNALGSGIAISNQAFINNGTFAPLAGTTTVADNTLIRTGAMNPNWNHPMSAIRIDSYDFEITSPVNVTGNLFQDSPYSAIEVVSGGGTGKPVRNLRVDNNRVDGVGTVVVQVEAPGSGDFSNLVASRVGTAGSYNCPYPSGTFSLNKGTGNSGWDSEWTDCGSWPPVNGGQPPADGNLARGRATSASGYQDVYRPANAVDGDANTYWESTNNAFPQWFTVDLGATRSVSRLVLKLPAHWGPRTQTITVEGGTGGAYSTVKASAQYQFAPNATVTFPPTDLRFIRLTFTANTGWPAGQLSEFEVFTA